MNMKSNTNEDIYFAIFGNDLDKLNLLNLYLKYFNF